MAWLNQTDNMCNNKENDHLIEFISKPNRLSGNGPRPDGKQIQLDSVRFSSIRQTQYDPSSFLWSNRLARLGSRACVTRSDFQYVQSSVPIADASQFHVLAM